MLCIKRENISWMQLAALRALKDSWCSFALTVMSQQLEIYRLEKNVGMRSSLIEKLKIL